MKPSDQSGTPGRPTPLTRKKANGQVLTRRSSVEEQITQVIGQKSEEVRKRVRIKDSDDGQFLSAECLVYLARDAQRRGDSALLRVVWEALTARVWPFVESNLRTLGSDYAEDGVVKVTSDMGNEILDLDSDRGDFLQVSFWTTIKRRAIDEFRRQLRIAKRDQKLTSLDAIPGEEGHSSSYGDEEHEFTSPPAFASAAKDPLEQLESAEDEALAEKSHAHKLALAEGALASLPEHIRRAYILHVREGWPIESKNPNEPTISAALGKTPRTIRNYLEEAEERLSKWREETR
jgi:DNA-directed RNA polymerase specialized sigma24 family protein